MGEAKSSFKYLTLPSGSKLIRFDSLYDIFCYDDITFNPTGLGQGVYHEEREEIEKYYKERGILTEKKKRIIIEAQKGLSIDKEFLGLVYKAKSLKRKYDLNKFTGNLSMSDYAANGDKIFKKSIPGAKKQTLNMAFQVGTFVGGNYNESFTRILKTILMCQAMNINVNIDMFDSDTRAINNQNGYVMVNVAKSSEKLNFRSILAASHREFFRVTLFNGYSASGCHKRIGTFVNEEQIVRDLGPMYDVIGGNMLLDPSITSESRDMISKILKIGIHG